jgi:RecA/RadA recombinase
LDKIKERFGEKTKVFLVVDSYGNTSSLRDSTISLAKEHEKPGGHAKTNRTGLGMLRAKMREMPIAMLIVNYTYDNIGSHGKTNAGGKALDFYSMLTIQTSRLKFHEKQVNGEKVRAGAEFNWKVFKNHYAKSLKNEDGSPLYLPKEITVRASSSGFERIS